jgi:hypothetical protein
MAILWVLNAESCLLAAKVTSEDIGFSSSKKHAFKV